MIDGSNWFDDEGRNVQGYVQIRSRLIFLGKEYGNLTPEQRDYEIGVIYVLVESIPLEGSREVYYRQVKDTLIRVGELEMEAVE